jgi:hypothetical protein
MSELHEELTILGEDPTGLLVKTLEGEEFFLKKEQLMHYNRYESKLFKKPSY